MVPIDHWHCSGHNSPPMADMIECSTHGQCQATYVCTHLVGESAGLGFNRNDPSDDNPFPDAWCDDCEIIRLAADGWDEESEKLAQIVMLCSGCYERARIRNTKTDVTLDDLKDLRWKCSSCEEWHTGPALDFGFDAPHYWTKEHAEAARKLKLMPSWSRKKQKTFLTQDFCAIDDENFFVRGVIHLPIIGAGETFRWGVWGSLSRDNFEKLLDLDNDPKRTELLAMFSWLSSQIADYPDTLSLKMYAHIQPVGTRPHFFLEPADHALAQEYHHGITAERVKEIMLRRTKDLRD
jgi:hypothetical protein